MRNVFRIVVVMVLGVLTGVSQAADPTLDKAMVGTYIFGPPLAQEDLQGRVVLFEFWGVLTGPPNLAYLAEVAKLQKKYPREIFLAVASHGQEADAPCVGAAWMAFTHDDSVSVVDRGQLMGMPNSFQLPFCYLFDATGKLVASGHPKDVHPKIDQLMQETFCFLAPARQFKAMKREAGQIAGLQGNLAGTIKRLRHAAASDKQPQQEEAKLLLDGLADWSRKQLTHTEKITAENALAAGERIHRMVSLLKGDELGVQWIALEEKLKADKAMQNEIKAADMLMKIRAQAFSSQAFVPEPGKGTVQANPSAEKAAIRAMLEQLSKKYPDTMAGRQATIYTSAWKL